jgi:hypothetical protein
MLEEQEETIEEWYFDKTVRNQIPLAKYLCEDRVLKNQDASCLQEVYVPPKEDTTDAPPTEDETNTQTEATMEKTDL